MGGGPSAFGQQLTKGFDQLKQQGQGAPQQGGMLFPEFKYTPQKGLQVNIGNEMISSLMQGLQQHMGGGQQAAPINTPGQQQLAQNQPTGMPNNPMQYPM